MDILRHFKLYVSFTFQEVDNLSQKDNKLTAHLCNKIILCLNLQKRT